MKSTTDYAIERLGSTTFALRPDYDAVVAELGGEPPLGMPIDCTFEWALDLAEKTVARQRRSEMAKARARAKAAKVAKAARVRRASDATASPAPSQKPVRRRTPAKKAAPKAAK